MVMLGYLLAYGPSLLLIAAGWFLRMGFEKLKARKS